MDQAQIRNVLKEYGESLRREYGEELSQVILYGSRSRLDAHEGSDIDVLCVMRDRFDYGEMIDRSSEVTSRLSLKYDVVLSRTFVTHQDYVLSKLPFVVNVRREGIRI